MYALGLKRINLHGVATLEEGLAAIEKGVKHILWDPGSWSRLGQEPLGRFPTRHDLDAVSKGRRYACPAKMYTAYGLTLRPSRFVELTGTLYLLRVALFSRIVLVNYRYIAGCAESLVWRNIPETDDEEAYNAAVEAIPHLWRMGITCIHARGSWAFSHSPQN